MEVDYVCNPGGHNRFIDVHTSKGHYIIDCEEDAYARWLINTMLTKGYFDASGIDYDNSNDSTWITYCINKTKEQKVFDRWIIKQYLTNMMDKEHIDTLLFRIE